MTDVGVRSGTGKETRYYTALGRATDYLLRCKDCRALVLVTQLVKDGCCPCGNKRVAEITTLSEQEQADIASGTIDFPHRAEFLAEFTAHE